MLEGLEISCVTPAPGWLLATVGQLGVAYDGQRIVVALATERDTGILMATMADDLAELEAIEAELEALPAEIAPAPMSTPVTPSLALVRVPRLDLALVTRAPERRRGIRIIELSPREREVVESCAEGHSNKEIAALLGISVHTVKFHVDGIIRKLGARNRTHAAVICVRRELAKA